MNGSWNERKTLQSETVLTCSLLQAKKKKGAVLSKMCLLSLRPEFC